MTNTVRQPAVAGTFYPADAAELRRQLAEFAKARERDARAVVAPHAGYRFSGETANLAISALPVDLQRVVVVGPSHHVAFDGVSIGDYAAYRTPLGDCPVDRQAVAELLAGVPTACYRPAVHEPEHCIEVEVPLLQTHCPEAALVPIVTGRMSAAECRALAERLRPLLDQPGTALVVSTDFTHYGPRFGYVPFPADQASVALSQLDYRSIEHLLAMAPVAFADWRAQSGTTICGWLGLMIMLHCLADADGGISGDLLHYCNSGDKTGSWANAVGYAALAFGPDRTDETVPTADREALLAYARAVIASRLAGENLPDEPTGLSAVCGQLRGGFVSLHEGPALRGCIGTIDPVSPVVETVRRNALAAAFRDPRFDAVAPEELPNLSIEISLLTEPEVIRDPAAIVIGRDGVILEVASRRAVFLPQVAPEQGWSRQETLRQLCRKAGLGDDAWRRPDATLSTFRAEVFAEDADAARESSENGPASNERRDH